MNEEDCFVEEQEEEYRLEVITDENETSKNRKRTTKGKGPVPAKITKTSPRNFLGSLFAPFRNMFGYNSADEEEEVQVVQASSQEAAEGLRKDDSVECIAFGVQEDVIVTSSRKTVCLPKPLPREDVVVVEDELEKSFEEQENGDDEVQVVGEVTVSPKSLLESQRRSVEEVMLAVTTAVEDSGSDSISIVSETQKDISPGPEDSISRQNTPRDFLDAFYTPRDSWSRRRKSHARMSTEKRGVIPKVGEKTPLGRIKKTTRPAAPSPYFTPQSGGGNAGFQIYAQKLKELNRVNRTAYVPKRYTGRSYLRIPGFNVEEYMERAKNAINSITNRADVVTLDDAASDKSDASGASVQVLSGDDEVKVLPSNNRSRLNYSSSAYSRLDDVLADFSSGSIKMKSALTSRATYHTEKSLWRRHEEELDQKNRQLSNNRKRNDAGLEDEIRERLELLGIKTPAPKPKEKDEFPELPQEAITIVDRAWSRANPGEVFTEGFDVKITRKDLGTLAGLGWLNDEVINFFLQLIVQRSAKDSSLPKVYSFNTFFYPNIAKKGHASVKRWTRKVDIFSYDMLLVPVHVGTVHWCMAIVDLAEKRIEYIDSMRGGDHGCIDYLQQYLMAESRDKKKVEFDMTGWEYVEVTDGPRQTNGSDCGVFSCRTAEYRSRRRAMNFSQEHMPYFRKRMVYEIVTKQLM